MGSLDNCTTRALEMLAKGLFLAVVILSGCQEAPTQEYDLGDLADSADSVRSLPGGGYNLLLEEGVSAGTFFQKIKDGKIDVDPKKVRVCDCADSSLINIDDPSVRFQLTGEGKPRIVQTDATGTSKTFSMAGLVSAIAENGTFQVKSSKYGLDGQAFDNLINSTKEALTFDEGKESVLVAIFDSGLHSDLLHGSMPWWTPRREVECVPHQDSGNLIKGVNFVADVARNQQRAIAIPRGRNYLTDNIQTEDGQFDGHGTFVTSLLIDQFSKYPRQSNLGILVMRVLNNERRGDNFGLNCAMLTARKFGAQLFNMSLGYRGEEDPVFLEILEGFNSDGLDAPPPMLVVAAGNEGEDLADPGATFGFYPANFGGGRRDDIITVTTVSPQRQASSGVSSGNNLEICEGQNFGADVVDVGVLTGKCYFPRITDPQNYNHATDISNEGSSYATPVIAGWLAATKDPRILARRNKGHLLSIDHNSSSLFRNNNLHHKIIENRVFKEP